MTKWRNWYTWQRAPEPKATATSNFFAAVVSGVASATCIFEVNAYEYPHASATEALRADWVRVGYDFATAIERVREEAKSETP